MFQITAQTPTVVKAKPVQSTTLPSSEKFTVLPGKYYNTSVLENCEGNHWKIKIDNQFWYVFKPHWFLEHLGITLTLDHLRIVYPWTERSILASNLPYLIEATNQYGIDQKPIRMMFFLAQIGHESMGLRHNVELSSGLAYEWRKDLGNIYPGDGPRYKGRGLIQLTGRINYRNAGKHLGIDLESNPELAQNVAYQSLIAGWYWSSRNLNFWSDKQDFQTVTRLINGGLNGWADRISYLKRASTLDFAVSIPNLLN